MFFALAHCAFVSYRRFCQLVDAPPIKDELSFSIGTLFNNYDIINRKTIKSSLVEHTPQYKKEKNRLENNIVETTQLNRSVQRDRPVN